jgi:hypothetical protein
MDARVPIDDKGQFANLEPKKNKPIAVGGRKRRLTRKLRKISQKRLRRLTVGRKRLL